jgi:hypothetical protein
MAELQNIVAQAQLMTDQIWCAGGSCSLGRTHQRAYTNAEVNVVSIGKDDFVGHGIDKVWMSLQSSIRLLTLIHSWTRRPGGLCICMQSRERKMLLRL